MLLIASGLVLTPVLETPYIDLVSRATLILSLRMVMTYTSSYRAVKLVVETVKFAYFMMPK